MRQGDAAIPRYPLVAKPFHPTTPPAAPAIAVSAGAATLVHWTLVPRWG